MTPRQKPLMSYAISLRSTVSNMLARSRCRLRTTLRTRRWSQREPRWLSGHRSGALSDLFAEGDEGQELPAEVGGQERGDLARAVVLGQHLDHVEADVVEAG